MATSHRIGHSALAAPYQDLKRCLLILRLLILDSSVDRGIPSLPAAPVGPETRPRLSANADSIISRSRSTSEAARGRNCSRSEEHTSELQSPDHLVCRLLLEKKKRKKERT